MSRRPRLDATVQYHVIQTLLPSQQEAQPRMLIITHDLAWSRSYAIISM